ncbi:MAG: leucine-rich repeat domain-containing protein [Oscillospiraceae bacterium]|nr:leucine-rich repeat domain-containing protein [Oscillospiraceae bacterium]
MKKSVAVILTLALLLGAVLYIAPVGVAEETSEPLTVSINAEAQNIATAINNALGLDGAKLKASYTGIILNVNNMTDINSENWKGLRDIFTDGWDNLTDLAIKSASLTSITYEGASVLGSDTTSPKWKNISLPESLRNINGQVFRNSTELKEININRVTGVTGLAFAGCKNLEAITVAQGNGTYISQDGIIYADGRRTLIIYPPGKNDGNTIIPAVIEDEIELAPAVTGFASISSSTTTLAMYSFTDVSSITSLLIPATVSEINSQAFHKTSLSDNYTLKSIYFNRSRPVALAAAYKNSLFNDTTAYVPKTTKKAYTDAYKDIFKAIEDNTHPDAELLGVMLRGYVGIGDFVQDNYKDISQLNVDGKPYNDQPIINDIDNKYLVDGEGPLPYIDVEAEEIVADSLPDGFTVAAFSVNGEKTWTAGDLSAANARLTTAFNSASVIVLANAYNTTTRKPAIGSDTITFMPVRARPGGNTYKLKLYYSDDDKWGLAKAPETNFSSLMDDLFIVQAGPDGKLPANPEWVKMSASGNTIADLPPKGTKKTTYFLRNAATSTSITTYLPAGRPWKVTPATKSKAPSYKVNYKKEILALKKGDVLMIKGEADEPDTPVDGPNLVKTDFNVSEHDFYGKTLKITKAATGKRPASMTLELKIAERAELVPPTITTANGKITTDLKKYEFYNGTKWGKLPKVSASAEFPVRVKQNAKVNKAGMTGNAASLPGTITLTWGVYDEEKNKSGILTAEITPPEPPEIPDGGGSGGESGDGGDDETTPETPEDGDDDDGETTIDP